MIDRKHRFEIEINLDGSKGQAFHNVSFEAGGRILGEERFSEGQHIKLSQSNGKIEVVKVDHVNRVSINLSFDSNGVYLSCAVGDEGIVAKYNELGVLDSVDHLDQLMSGKLRKRRIYSARIIDGLFEENDSLELVDYRKIGLSLGENSKFSEVAVRSVIIGVSAEEIIGFIGSLGSSEEELQKILDFVAVEFR